MPRWFVLVWASIGVVVALTVGEHALADWLRSAGVGVIGDQPAYLTQAQSLLQGSVHPLAVFQRDLAAHYFSAFPPGTKIGPGVFEGAMGPRGVVSPFEPGLALLVAPFLAIGGQSGAFVGFFALEIGGLVFVHQRVSRLCRLGWRAQTLLGVAFAAPAVAVAATQLYPDLISGVFLAAALIELARFELDEVPGWVTLATVATGVAVLPWLQIKNLAPALVVCAAFAVVAWRHRRPRHTVVVVLVVAVVSWGLLAAYNLRYFGHLLGLPEPAPAWDKASIVRTVALLFDRHQGLFVQLPTATLGVFGLSIVWSKAGWAAASALVAVASVLVLNGTYASNPFGGTTLAGRFEWTAMPVAVAFGAFALQRWQDRQRALLQASLVLVAAWGLQAAVLVSYDHADSYFTQLSSWDPAAVPGWWPGLDRLLPEFRTSPHLLGHLSVGVALVVVLSAALVWIPTLPVLQPRRIGQPPVVFAGVGVAALAAVIAAADPGNALPAKLTFPGAALTSPLVAATKAVTGPAVTLQGIMPGTYRLVATYSLGGPNPAALSAYCDATAAGGEHLRAQRATLPPGAHTATIQITCTHSGGLAAQLWTPGHSRLRTQELTLTKTGRA